MSIFNHRDKDINRFNAHQFSNRPFYLDKKNQLAIDKVCKWESINSEMQEVARKIGLDWDGQIPKTKANHRPKGPHWQEYFDNELREAAKRHFALELELFGYDAI